MAVLDQLGIWFQQEVGMLYGNADAAISAFVRQLSQRERLDSTFELEQLLELSDEALVQQWSQQETGWGFSNPSGLRKFLMEVLSKLRID